MEFDFSSFETSFAIDIIREHTQSEANNYSSIVDINSVRESDNHYNLSFNCRYEVKINGKELTEESNPMDRILLDLGNSLYPITFNILSNGDVTDIPNYDEIKERWEKNSELYMEQSIYVDKYITMSRCNFESKEKLFHALMKDSFIQLYITIAQEKFQYDAYNFPQRCNVRRFIEEDRYVEQNENNNNTTQISGKNFGVNYKQDKKGRLIYFNSLFSIKDGDDEHALKIKINNIKNK